MKRKIMVFLGVLAVVFNVSSFALSGNAYAAGGKNCGAGSFLGLRPWYAGLCAEGKDIVETPSSQDGLVSFIWKIVLNVLFDMLLLVGYIATCIVVYGGFLYITAQGDPAKVAKAKKTLTAAALGTMIVMLASVIVNTAIVVLGIDQSKGLAQSNTATEVIASVLNWLYAASGLVAVVYIVKGGVDYVTSQGDPGKVKKATQSLIYAVVGLVVVVMAAIITSFVTGAISGAIK